MEESTTLEHIHFNPILNHTEKDVILNLKRHKIEGHIENSIWSEHNSGRNNFQAGLPGYGKKNVSISVDLSSHGKQRWLLSIELCLSP